MVWKKNLTRKVISKRYVSYVDTETAHKYSCVIYYSTHTVSKLFMGWKCLDDFLL